MNPIHEKRISKKIECYFRRQKLTDKIGKYYYENVYLFLFDKKCGLMLRHKKSTNECAFMISNEKHFPVLAKTKGLQKIPFKSGLKRCIDEISKMPNPGGEVMAFTMLLIEKASKEIQQLAEKRNKSRGTTPPKPCCHGG